jgi:hypothetical protein
MFWGGKTSIFGEGDIRLRLKYRPLGSGRKGDGKSAIERKWISSITCNKALQGKKFCLPPK